MAILGKKTAAKWTTHQKRKANYFAFLGIAVSAVALWACGQPWIATAYSGTPTCPISASAQTLDLATMDGTKQTVTIPATCDTGWTLSQAAQQRSALVKQAAGNTGIPMTAMGDALPMGIGGLPMMVFVVAAAGILIAAGAYLRLTLGPLLGGMFLVYGAKYSSATWAYMTGSYNPDQLATQVGWTVLSVANTVALVLALVSGIYVLKVNIAARAKAAKEENKPSKSAMVAEIGSLVLRQASSLSTARSGENTVSNN